MMHHICIWISKLCLIYVHDSLFDALYMYINLWIMFDICTLFSVWCIIYINLWIIFDICTWFSVWCIIIIFVYIYKSLNYVWYVYMILCSLIWTNISCLDSQHCLQQTKLSKQLLSRNYSAGTTDYWAETILLVQQIIEQKLFSWYNRFIELFSYWWANAVST